MNKKKTNIYRNSREESESLNRYLIEISKIKLLTQREEVSLAFIVRNEKKKYDKITIYKGINKNKKFKNALEKLVKSNLRFVVSVAKQYQNQGLSLSDLINEGNLGLMKAALRFDETRGFKFISYAVWWIRQCILQAIADLSKSVRTPTNKIAFLNKVNKANLALEQLLHRSPTNKELSTFLGVEENEIYEVLKCSNKYISLDAPLIEGEESNLYDIIKLDELPKPDISLEEESLKIDIKRCLNILSKREAQVTILCCGLFGYPTMTYEEVAKFFGLTRERVRQIQISALKKLKSSHKSKILKNYL